MHTCGKGQSVEAWLANTQISQSESDHRIITRARFTGSVPDYRPVMALIRHREPACSDAR